MENLIRPEKGINGRLKDPVSIEIQREDLKRLEEISKKLSTVQGRAVNESKLIGVLIQHAENFIENNL